jgi:hypothetical protein
MVKNGETGKTYTDHDTNVDQAYSAKFLGIARLLWQASEGDPTKIPADYAAHLNHTYADGSCSLVGLLPLVQDYSELEDFEWDEAIELLGRVNPNDWPNIEDISGISLEEILKVYDTDATDTEGFNFVEDNLSTAEKVEKTLIEAISSVFGDRVSTIRSEKGYYANQKNSFLQEDDGTFAGTFMYDGHKFIFEVYPDENGWGCTYRLHWDSVDKLPPLHDEDKKDETNYTRRVRHRGWK